MSRVGISNNITQPDARCMSYEDNPKFYEHLCFGTEKEWDEETKKQESGFMFAPTEPCNPSASPNVITHWQSIVNGNVPFGLKIEEG
jgi:hypothetical protein